MHFEYQVDDERRERVPRWYPPCERCGQRYDPSICMQRGTICTLDMVERDVVLCRSCARDLDNTLAAFLPERFGGMP